MKRSEFTFAKNEEEVRSIFQVGESILIINSAEFYDDAVTIFGKVAAVSMIQAGTVDGPKLISSMPFSGTEKSQEQIQADLYKRNRFAVFVYPHPAMTSFSSEQLLEFQFWYEPMLMLNDVENCGAKDYDPIDPTIFIGFDAIEFLMHQMPGVHGLHRFIGGPRFKLWNDVACNPFPVET